MQPEESGDSHGEKVNKKKSADNACFTKYPSQKPIGCVAGVQLVAMNIPQQLIGAVVSQNRKHPLWSIKSSPLSQVGRWSDQGPVKEEKLLLQIWEAGGQIRVYFVHFVQKPLKSTPTQGRPHARGTGRHSRLQGKRH